MDKKIIKCKIIKMYINNQKLYYLVNVEDLENYYKTGFLPYIVAMKYKKYLLEHIKKHSERYSNIKIMR